MNDPLQPFQTFFEVCDLDCGPLADDEIITSYRVQGIKFTLTAGDFRRLIEAHGKSDDEPGQEEGGYEYWPEGAV